MKDKNTLV
uniref:Uncharacterized protein n=1 Tax=Arundo donax TaxID=35708 RepID=A0A0A9A7E2_ARUDO